ncbi:MAG: BlaI/MecI/CopY family transcriptional regulator [Lachnospiraceae bacterium]
MKKLPDTEFEIMSIIWMYDRSVTTNDIYSHLEKDKWKVPTIISFLKRLENKGFVTSEKNGKERYYTATVTQDDYVKFETQLFFDKYHKNSFASFMTALCNSEKIDENELKLLERKIDEWIGDE